MYYDSFYSSLLPSQHAEDALDINLRRMQDLGNELVNAQNDLQTLEAEAGKLPPTVKEMEAELARLGDMAESLRSLLTQPFLTSITPTHTVVVNKKKQA